MFWRQKQQLASVADFFKRKRDWSKYKDLILDYYLEPYLQKVKQIGKPILVVDCFAGPGRFDDGQPGSPLIIAQHLSKLCRSGHQVAGFFVEANKSLYDRLKQNLSDLEISAETYLGSFRDCIGEISRLAGTHTVFVYLDPFRPKHLLFNDLQTVYDQLKSGQSVETLINFMSASFLRGVHSFREKIILDGELKPDHPLVLQWNEIAGGPYWQRIAFDPGLSADERADQLADGYASKLSRWFKWTLIYPIREKYEHTWPKYHLIFGSRYPDAVDLMNMAMVKARREFIKKDFIDGYLFAIEPEKEMIIPAEVQQAVIETIRHIGKTTWANLRVRATIANPAKYTGSEFDNAIKRAIREGKLRSDCAGTRIEQKAFVWPVD